MAGMGQRTLAASSRDPGVDQGDGVGRERDDTFTD
jgi:hypothetical protein